MVIFIFKKSQNAVRCKIKTAQQPMYTGRDCKPFEAGYIEAAIKLFGRKIIILQKIFCAIFKE